jgi:hypothetical protein
MNEAQVIFQEMSAVNSMLTQRCVNLALELAATQANAAAAAEHAKIELEAVRAELAKRPVILEEAGPTS